MGNLENFAFGYWIGSLVKEMTNTHQPHPWNKNCKKCTKVIIIGPPASGKTSYAKLLSEGGFSKNYETTMGVKTYNMSIPTNRGDANLQFWDTAGQEKYGGLADGYYVDANYALVFLDVSMPKLLKDVKDWMNRIHKVEPSLKFIVCGNKIDWVGKKVTPKNVYQTISEKASSVLDYVEMSCIKKRNTDKPVLILLQDMFKDPNLQVLSHCAHVPSMDIAAQAASEVSKEQMNQIMEQAQSGDIFEHDFDFDMAPPA